MKAISVCLILAHSSFASADTKLETIHGISTTAHEISPLPVRSRETLIAGREPTKEESNQPLSGYRLRWTVSIPDPRPEAKRDVSGNLTLRVWDQIDKHFPGWNPPIVEIFSGTTRLKCQELTEVGWAVDVWSETHHSLFLYVRTKHRHRLAEGDNVYELNPEDLKLEHKGVHFSKEELVRENAEMRAALDQGSKPNGGQSPSR